MKLEVRNAEGDVVGVFEASDYVWAEPVRPALLHQAVVAQQASKRTGTHNTKRRSEVFASGRKLRSQKHTGRARLGSGKSPTMRGGGVAHGPHPRSYRQRLPVKMRRAALRMALSEKVRQGRLIVLDRLKIDEPRTRVVKDLLANVSAAGSTLLVTEATDHVARRSASNLQGVDVLAAPLLNPLQAVAAGTIVITQDAVRRVDEIWGRPPAKHPAREAEAVSGRPL